MKKLILILSVLMLFPYLSAAETVVTSFYPVWVMTLNLTRGLENSLSVRNLAAPSVGCLHDYQLQTADMKILSDADAFLVNGAGMESFLPEIIHALPDLPIIEASVGIDLLENVETVELLGPDEEETVNSHVWLDPSRAIHMAENLASGLSCLFPSDQKMIMSNLEDYRTRLTALDQELRDGLQGLSHRNIVTFHEAFPYFADAYDLHVVAVVNREPGEVLTPSQIGSLAREIIRLGNPPLFVEPQYTDLSARTLARETGSSVYSLDPMVTGPEEKVPLDYYETVMRQNMENLIEALSAGSPQ